MLMKIYIRLICSSRRNNNFFKLIVYKILSFKCQIFDKNEILREEID